jgi:protein-S-isoprenylcysteine O-methyltransferase Ste14
MDIYEKAGDFLLNVVQLIIGGVIFANVMNENLNSSVLYITGSIVVIVFLGITYWLFRISKKINK